MKKYIYLIAVITTATLYSCSSYKQPVLNAQMTEKDSLMVQISKEYIPTSVVGSGGLIAAKEAKKREIQHNRQREERLKQIAGLKISRVKTDGDSIFDFIAEMSDIFFEYDSFELTPEASAAIDDLAKSINDQENHITITGYTDNWGDDKYNLNLSKLRAVSVGNKLRENGISDITEIGKGKNDPIATNATEAGRKRNRRVEIKISTK